MNIRKALATALAAACGLACTTPLYARDHDDGRRDGGRHEERRDDRRDGRFERDRGGPPASGYRYGRERYDFGPRDYPRGAGPDHRFHRGDRLASQYRGRQYVVDDWRGHRLNPPPRGYQWVQVGGDYVMVAIATGIIASLILNQ